jgi:hypothetical protein
MLLSHCSSVLIRLLAINARVVAVIDFHCVSYDKDTHIVRFLIPEWIWQLRLGSKGTQYVKVMAYQHSPVPMELTCVPLTSLKVVQLKRYKHSITPHRPVVVSHSSPLPSSPSRASTTTTSLNDKKETKSRIGTKPPNNDIAIEYISAMTEIKGVTFVLQLSQGKLFTLYKY